MADPFAQYYKLPHLYPGYDYDKTGFRHVWCGWAKRISAFGPYNAFYPYIPAKKELKETCSKSFQITCSP